MKAPESERWMPRMHSQQREPLLALKSQHQPLQICYGSLIQALLLLQSGWLDRLCLADGIDAGYTFQSPQEGFLPHATLHFMVLMYPV